MLIADSNNQCVQVSVFGGVYTVRVQPSNQKLTCKLRLIVRLMSYFRFSPTMVCSSVVLVSGAEHRVKCNGRQEWLSTRTVTSSSLIMTTNGSASSQVRANSRWVKICDSHRCFISFRRVVLLIKTNHMWPETYIYFKARLYFENKKNLASCDVTRSIFSPTVRYAVSPFS